MINIVYAVYRPSGFEAYGIRNNPDGLRISFHPLNGLFPQSLRQTARFLVRRTKVRLRETPCFPLPCEKILIFGLETFFVSLQQYGWTRINLAADARRRA